MDIIIGAGISGLSYAMFKQHGDYLILEKDHTIGGYCRTTKRNGHVWDYSGHFFHFQNPEIKKALMADMDPASLVCVNKCTHIKYKDRLIDFPFQKNIHQLSQEEFIDCLVDLFESDNSSTYATFKEMLYAKFGKSIANKFLIPYNEKLYATDLDKLDHDAMGRFFPYAEKIEIIKNFRHAHNESYNGFFVYPKGGAITYINQIASHLESNSIRIDSHVIKIDPEAKNIYLDNGDTLTYDRIISSIPFPTLLDLTSTEYDHELYSWNQVLVFNLGFDTKGPDIHNHWIYFPEDKYCFYRVGFYDNILNSDRSSLYVELGFSKNDHIQPDKWLPKVISELKTAGIINHNQQLVDHEAIVMNPAYVHISNDVRKDIALKKQYLESKDIYSIGRYGSWTYCSIEDNIIEARQLACRLNEIKP